MTDERHRVEGERFRGLLDAALAFDSPHVDVAPLLGWQSPLLVGVDELHRALLHVAVGAPELPALSVRWNQSEVTLEPIEGGALATLTVKF
jgi:hypothetical protein